MSSTLYKKDVSLIDACTQGDEEGWSQFIENYGRLVRSVVSKFTYGQAGASANTEDLIGHVYEKLLENECRRLSGWRRRAKFSTYLVQVVRNLALDYLKKEGRAVKLRQYDDMSRIPDPSEHPEEDDLRRMRRTALQAAIEKLPDSQALIMRLRLEGKTLREIAEITNRPVGTVSVQNSRAMEKLRKAMEDGGAGSGGDGS